MSVQERVARGVRWLDGVRPGWRDALELSTLDLDSTERCVLGQVFGDDAEAHGHACGGGYTWALLMVAPRGDRDWPAAHGFMVGPAWVTAEDMRAGAVSLDMPEAARVALEDEWRRVIHLPREECGVSVLG